ncbi:MAG: hypothetical protein AAFY90_01425 [Pseudomonadota bacterium]
MQRLVFAIIVLAVLVAVLAVALAGVRAITAPKEAEGARKEDSLPKVAFLMLAGLMVYAATTGLD